MITSSPINKKAYSERLDMNRTKHLQQKILIIFCSLVCLSIGGSLSFGQKTSKQSTQKLSCKVGNISFICPQGFKPLSEYPELSFSLLYNKKYDLGLFVVAPEPEYDGQKLLSDVAKTTLSKLFPKESHSYKWKSASFSDSVSKYEVGGGMVKGFNGNLVVIVKYRQIKFKGRDIFVGYAVDFGKGKEAREFFDSEGAGDSMPACNASVELIYSITGEKIDEDDLPCSLTVLRD